MLEEFAFRTSSLPMVGSWLQGRLLPATWQWARFARRRIRLRLGVVVAMCRALPRSAAELGRVGHVARAT